MELFVKNKLSMPSGRDLVEWGPNRVLMTPKEYMAYEATECIIEHLNRNEELHTDLNLVIRHHDSETKSVKLFIWSRFRDAAHRTDSTPKEIFETVLAAIKNVNKIVSVGVTGVTASDSLRPTPNFITQPD